MHSMTGFGRGEAVANGVIWRAEISSVNRKQLEVVVHLPRELNELEAAIRQRLATQLSRGRVQANINVDEGSGAKKKVCVDEALARQYLDSMRNIAATFGAAFTPDAAEMARWPGVFAIEESAWKPEEAQPLIEEAVDSALRQMLSMRSVEGTHLKADIGSRLLQLRAWLAEARELSPLTVERHRQALHQRLAQAGLPIPLEDERLVKEIALFADRCDMSEEITRAESHITQFFTYMDSGESIGRSLDFLSQELFRELNTMSSKANDAALSHLTVRAKTELEKIREQVQNIE